MSDFAHRRGFEAWLAGELRRTVVTDAAGPERVMSFVRASAVRAHRRHRGATPATAFAFAACVIGVFAFRMATLLVPSTSAASFAEGRAGLRDTISAFTDSMRGTARLVSVAVIAPAAARIAVAHDFHGWDLHIDQVAQRDERAIRDAALSIAPGLRLSPMTIGATLDPESTSRSSMADSVPEPR
jgi:hypothetical protein